MKGLSGGYTREGGRRTIYCERSFWAIHRREGGREGGGLSIVKGLSGGYTREGGRRTIYCERSFWAIHRREGGREGGREDYLL